MPKETTSNIEESIVSWIIFARSGFSINIAVMVSGEVPDICEHEDAITKIVYNNILENDRALAGGSGKANEEKMSIEYPRMGGFLVVSAGKLDGYFDEVPEIFIGLDKND